jgi:hypothetical protein
MKKELSEEEAHDLGIDAEQKMAENICDQIDTEDPNVDIAFIGCFGALTTRLLNFFDREYLIEIINDMPDSEPEPDDNESDLNLN